MMHRADARRRELAADGPPRYLLAGGKVGLPTRRQALRTLAGGALWFGAPPLLLGMLGRVGARRAFHIAQRWWARQVARALDLRLEIDGLEHLNRREAYVVAPLHEGFVDILALLHLPLPLRFVARDELFGWRRLGPFLRATGQIIAYPEQGRRSYRHLLRAAPAIFAAGESLVLFPQGSILGIEIDCWPGAFALARALDRPILPVALTGSHRVWEYPFTPRLRYGQRVSLRALPPVSAADCRACSMEQLRAEVQGRLKGAALSGALAPPRRFVPARDGYWDGYAYRIDPQFPALATEIARHRREQAVGGDAVAGRG